MAKKPRVVETIDYSQLLKKKLPKAGVERLREEALKEILPVEVKPGAPLEARIGNILNAVKQRLKRLLGI